MIFWLVATKLKSTASTGAVQGPTITPDRAPTRKLATMPFLFGCAFARKPGTRMGSAKTSSMDNPIRIQILATMKFVQGLACICPNSLPVKAAIAARAVYVTDMPKT